MLKNIITLVLIILVPGCTFPVMEIRLPNGTTALQVSCDGNLQDWGSCTQQAELTCGATGYDTVSRREDVRVVTSPGSPGGSVTDRRGRTSSWGPTPPQTSYYPVRNFVFSCGRLVREQREREAAEARQAQEARDQEQREREASQIRQARQAREQELREREASQARQALQARERERLIQPVQPPTEMPSFVVPPRRD